MLNGFLMIAVVSTISGCLTLPVKGEYKEASEKFLGSATGYMNGNGDISIVSENDDFRAFPLSGYQSPSLADLPVNSYLVGPSNPQAREWLVVML